MSLRIYFHLFFTIKGCYDVFFCAQYVYVAESLFTTKEESDKYFKT